MALVSKLKIGPKIGNGHFGEVFAAEDPVHGDVAVKLMTEIPGEPKGSWDKRREGLLSEAQNLAKAKHANVVQVHHCVERDDGTCIQFCMALCPGGSLQSKFETGPMQTSEVLSVATDVTLGLQALHQRGMLHRDIKPANILLDENGKAMLGDFGLVTDDLVYGYASAQGYLDHLAPEVWTTRLTSPKSDVWALGMTLYRLLHGHLWYSQITDLHQRIPAGGFASKLPWLPHIPKEWRRLIRKMMHDNPDSRIANADELLGALARLPVEGEWACYVQPSLCSWERVVGSRRHRVEWQEHSSRRHEWRAWSEPLGKGRNRAMGKSDGVVGKGDNLAGLENFFTNH